MQADTAAALREALARAEAAEARAQQLEQQADNLAQQVALLEVGMLWDYLPPALVELPSMKRV